MRVSNNMICKRIRMNVVGIKEDMKILYGMPNPNTRNMLLRQISHKLDEIEFLSHMNDMDSQRQKVFTLQELAQYDGKNGKPAYVVVDKLVYDVTDNGAWAAGTHFGLTAGKDVSTALETCHGGEDILSKLAVVGRIA